MMSLLAKLIRTSEQIWVKFNISKSIKDESWNKKKAVLKSSFKAITTLIIIYLIYKLESLSQSEQTNKKDFSEFITPTAGLSPQVW